jgi:aldose 1-epimerase
MTNHGIFNLAGEGSPMGAMGHRLTMPAKAYTPVMREADPDRRAAARSRAACSISRMARTVADGMRDGRDEQIRFGQGYDHNFVIDKGRTAEPSCRAAGGSDHGPRAGSAHHRARAPGLYRQFPGRHVRGQAGASLSAWATASRSSRRNSPTRPISRPSARHGSTPGKPYRHVHDLSSLDLRASN